MTNNASTKSPLVLSALRARMGDWVYYITFMKMKDISERIERTQRFYSSRALENIILGERLQRDVLAGRAEKIKHYLLSQKQRFFNSLVIGTFGGDPQWNEIRIEQNIEADPDLGNNFEGILGFLTLSGSEKLFAIDGQHRVEGIKEAVKKHVDLENEEVPIILVRGVTLPDRNKDVEGYQRTRRLFTTLNRYAKPGSKKDIIILDEDDTIAIITRQLIEEYPLFLNKISVKASTSMSVNDKKNLISINALYDALDIYLIDRPKSGWDEFKKFYPSEEKVKEFYERSIALWDILCDYFPQLKEVKESDPEDKIPGKYRNREGGNVLFRPIGLQLYIKTIRHLIDYENLSLEQAVQRVSNVPVDLSSEPWAYLIWNPQIPKILTASANLKATEKLLFHSVGGDLAHLNSSSNILRKEIAAIREKEEQGITLPVYVTKLE